MWGSLQLDWPFSLVVVVIAITSRSHRSPSTDDCKYSTPACVSVCPSTVVGSLLCVAAISPFFLPHITPAHLSQLSHPSLISSSCSLLFSFSSSSLSNSVSHFEKTGAWCIPWLVPIGSTTLQQSSPINAPPPPPTPRPSSAVFLSETLSSNRKWNSSVASGVTSFLLMHPFTETPVGWLWSLGSLVSGVPPHPVCPPLSLPLPPVWAVFCPLPYTPHCGFVACIWSLPTLQSSLSIQHCTVLFVCADRHVGLSWFQFMFCGYSDGIMSAFLMHRIASFWQDVTGLNWRKSLRCIQCTVRGKLTFRFLKTFYYYCCCNWFLQNMINIHFTIAIFRKDNSGW